jgi:hypothetical protein
MGQRAAGGYHRHYDRRGRPRGREQRYSDLDMGQLVATARSAVHALAGRLTPGALGPEVPARFGQPLAWLTREDRESPGPRAGLISGATHGRRPKAGTFGQDVFRALAVWPLCYARLPRRYARPSRDQLRRPVSPNRWPPFPLHATAGAT